jgi:hypothetical protein
MLTILLPFVVIYYNTAIALGLGSSSVVIASFLAAVSDNKIDPSERRLLGVIYITLRVAMVSIALMLTYISLVRPELLPSLLFLWVMVAVLYLNAVLMTLHVVPTQLGPALQAATWYTLAFVTIIDAFSLYAVSLTLFLSLYVADIIFALVAVNGMMMYLKHRARSRC